VDISLIPDELAAYPDDTIAQSAIMKTIVGTSRQGEYSEKAFNEMPLKSILLSKLGELYERDDPEAVNLLSCRHVIEIDKDLQAQLGNGQTLMNTDETMIDYQMTVANCVGFSPLLPNAPSGHQFEFEMDLKKPFNTFKGKHATLGFDPAGCMLYLGQCRNDDVFLAMAPNEFLGGHTQPTPSGSSSASPLMSRRHYRQVLMMIVYFLSLIPQCSFYILKDTSVYELELDSSKPCFERITETLYVFPSVPSHDPISKPPFW
jgi:hypothetical protein